MTDDDVVEAFVEAVRAGGQVLGLADDAGFPAPEVAGGVRAMPFWSRRSRAERVRSTVPAYRALAVVALPLELWRDRWLPGLAADGLRVGLDWSGPAAAGVDVDPDGLRARLLG